MAAQAEARVRSSQLPGERAWTTPALALLLALPFLLRLGAAPLFDVDEGAFSEATREMLASGDWGFTTLNGAVRFDKPILVYWLQAACVWLLGVNEAAFRLPLALCAWAWCLATVHFSAPRLGRPAAWLAGAVAATSLGVLVIGRAATADGLLNLLLALALFDAWRHLENGAMAPLRRAYAWIGLGLLAKGPVAVLVPGATVLLYCLFSGRPKAAWRAFSDARGWALLLVIALPWYAYALHRHGQAFVDGFFIRHNLARYGSVLEGHSGSVLYYLLVLPLLLLPWSALLVPLVARLRALWALPLPRFLLLWAGFVLVFFSFSGTKLPHYALYGATPLFMLIADTARQRPRRAAWLVLPVAALVAVLAGLLPELMAHTAAQVGDPLYRALIDGADAIDARTLHAGLAAALLAGALIAWQCRSPLLRSALCAGVLALLLTAAASPWLGEVLQGPVREAGALARGGQPAVQWGVHQPSFGVYRGQPTPRLGQQAPLPPGALALAREDRLPAQPGLRVVWRQRGFVLVLAER